MLNADKNCDSHMTEKSGKIGRRELCRRSVSTKRLPWTMSCRKRMTQAQLNETMGEIGSLLHRLEVRPAGPVVTTTFSLTQTAEGAVMDAELLVPLDRPVECPPGYQIKPHFLLANAVKLRHMGNPAYLQQSTNELTDFIRANDLTPITTSYNVTVQGAAAPAELDNMIVDIYVGVSPNIL